MSALMFAIATASLLTLVNGLSGTPYIIGGNSPAGTDCSGLVSFVTNAATGRPIYGERFNTGNIESALKACGFVYGTKPGALNVGWNRGHTAATLPDGTPVSSGEGGGVKVGGGGLPEAVLQAHVPRAAAAPTRGSHAASSRSGGRGASPIVPGLSTVSTAAVARLCTAKRLQIRCFASKGQLGLDSM